MLFARITKVADADFPTLWGHFRILGFEGVIENSTAYDHNLPTSSVRIEATVALVMGDIHNASPIVRIHSQCLSGEVFHSLHCDCRRQVEFALATIADAGAGILLYQQPEGRGIGLMATPRSSRLQDEGLDTMEAKPELGYESNRCQFALPAQILKQLGVESVRLITNDPGKVEALELAGIKVVERIDAGVASEHYLGTMGEKDRPPSELVSCVRSVVDY